MKKFEDNLKSNDYEELFLRIAWHYSENIIDWWFGIRQEFPLRPQQAFPYIKEMDPEFYNELLKNLNFFPEKKCSTSSEK